MRTDLLVHWTGRDIVTNRFSVNDEHRQRYIERLVDIIDNGFWMTTPTERIQGGGGLNSWIQYLAHMTCFTEVRLSQTELHTQRYGLLGVGVSRRFVLERYGSPVHYVRNHCSECIVENADVILNKL